MRSAGIDHLLAQHVAHLFIRDPVSLFSEKVHQNDEEDSDHFEVRVARRFSTFFRFKNVFFFKSEPSIDQLADDALQTTASAQHHRLAGRVPALRGPDYGL